MYPSKVEHYLFAIIHMFQMPGMLKSIYKLQNDNNKSNKRRFHGSGWCGGTAFDLSGRYHIRQRSGSKSSRRKERILKVDEAHCNNNENDVQTISHNGGDFFSQCAERALYLVFFMFFAAPA